MSLAADKSCPPLVAELARLAAAAPDARKILIGPDRAWGRELLAALAHHTGGWIGWEASTMRLLADELALVPLSERGLRAANDVELAAATGRALDACVAARSVHPGFASLAGGLGFRGAVRDTLLELRTGGVSAAALRAEAPPASPAADVSVVLESFEAELARLKLADPAAVFRAALDAFEVESPFVLGNAQVFVAPELRLSGLPGALIERLLATGARPLAVAPIREVPAPERLVARVAVTDESSSSAAAPIASGVLVDLFLAATPVDEVREVLRRTIGEGLRWDQVELVTTDPDTYGIALDAVCRHLGVPYTSLRGLPLGRVRAGRALARWLLWLGDGLPSDTLREVLEAGDVALPGSSVPSSALARRLRGLGIGWGRGRYEEAIRRLRSADRRQPDRRDGEDDIAYADRRAAYRRTDDALVSLLERLLSITPAAPERGDDRAVSSSLSALAGATLGFLELVPRHGMAEQQAGERVELALQEIAATPTPDTGFGHALAELRDALTGLRAWPGDGAGTKPWSSTGGHLHLTDLTHAGTSGRSRVFVLGLDADRAAGPRIQDAFVGDALRARLGGGALPTTTERGMERTWVAAQGLARIRGRVTLSYSQSGEDGRPVGPAHLLLDAFRQLEGDRSLSYDALRDRLGAPACAVPRAGTTPLDGRETWLAALASGGILLDGEVAIRAAHPELDAALRAAAEREGPEPSALHGWVRAAAGAHDPTTNGRAISPTSLELLAKCPLAWFYAYVLRLTPPDDAVYDTARWLDEGQRGELLHALYEHVGRMYIGRQAALREPGARDEVLAVADELIERWRDTVPPPSDAVFRSEADELRQAALAFLDAEGAAADASIWRHFELELGEASDRLVLPDGRALLLRGKVDRVDELPSGELLAVDYKTGKPGRFEHDRKGGAFRGGRTLQAAIYAAGVAARYQRKVARFEYRFPTARGQNRVVLYGPSELAAAPAIVQGLLGHITRGEFVPTNDKNDCRYCDHQAICRTRVETFNVDSPRAGWAEDNAEQLEAYRDMLKRRTPADGGTR